MRKKQTEGRGGKNGKPLRQPEAGCDEQKVIDGMVVKNMTYEGEPDLEHSEEKVFRRTLSVMNKTGISYAVGAAFARNVYTGIWRSTKDLDLFLKPGDVHTALQALSDAGFIAWVEAENWLAKAKLDDYLIDLIFSTGNGHIAVDDSWFERTHPAEVFGIKTQLVAVEEMISTAVFVSVRNRFDGAEVAHLIHGMKGKVDWQRILDLLGEHRELLLWHLIFFDFVYPSHSEYLPQQIMIDLFAEIRKRWKKDPEGKNPKAFRGMLLDPFSFQVDVEDWGYEDQRKLDPLVEKID